MVVIQDSFSSGIISPLITGRSSLDIYINGLKNCIDGSIGIIGGITNESLDKVQVGTWSGTLSSQPTYRIATKDSGSNNYTMYEGTLYRDGKVYKSIETKRLEVNLVDSTGVAESKSKCTPRTGDKAPWGGSRKFCYHPRNTFFHIEKLSSDTGDPPSIITVQGGIGRYKKISKAPLTSGTKWDGYEYEAVETPALETARVNSSGDIVVEDHTIDATDVYILAELIDTFDRVIISRNRLIGAGARNNKSKIIFSSTEDKFDFENNDNTPSQGIVYEFDEGQIVYDVFNFKSLIFYTNQGIWAMDRFAGLTPTNVIIDEVIAVQPALDIAPAKVGDKLFFVNKSKNRVYMLQYKKDNDVSSFTTADATIRIEGLLEDITSIFPVETSGDDTSSYLYVETKTGSWLLTIVSDEEVINWTKLSNKFDFVHYQYEAVTNDIIYFGSDNKTYKLKKQLSETKVEFLKPSGNYAVKGAERPIVFNKDYFISSIRFLVRGDYEFMIGTTDPKDGSFTQYDNQTVIVDGKEVTSNDVNDFGADISRNRFSVTDEDIHMVEFQNISFRYSDIVTLKIGKTNKTELLAVEYEVNTQGGGI